MTIRDKTDLTARFEQLDVPTGTDFADFIQSCVNLAETTAQAMAGPLSCTEIVASRVSANTASYSGIVSASKISCDAGTAGTGGWKIRGVCSAGIVRFTESLHGQVEIVSASGTTQGAANLIPVSAYVARLQGVNDGTATGFTLQTSAQGYVQYVINETAASANLWPPTDGKINALATNAAFGLAANTQYTVIHVLRKEYRVK